MTYECKCGHCFPNELGAYGCPGCCADSGKATLLPNLAACPGCGGNKSRVYSHSNIHYAECINADCHMSGPIGETHRKAIDNWNKLPRTHTA